MVAFSLKDYRYGGRKSLLRLSNAEFIRRFALHVLPKGFVRIRHYGILSSCKKKVVVPLLRKELGCTETKGRPPLLHRLCPACKRGGLITIAVFDGRGPPGHWPEKLQDQRSPFPAATAKMP